MDNSVVEDKKAEMVIEEKKSPRKPTAYNEFVKKNYKKCSDLPVKERFAALGKMWKEKKMKKAEKKVKN